MSITGSEEAYYCDCKTFCGGVWTQIKRSTAFKHERVRKDLEQAGEDGVDWPSGSNNHRTGGMDELRLPAEFERQHELPESVELCQNSDNFWDEAVGRDLGLSSKRCQEEEDEEKDVEEADEVHSSVDEDSSESDGEEGPSGDDKNPRDSEREDDIRNSEKGCESEDGPEVADLDSRLAQDVWEHDRFIQEQFKLYESMGFTQVVSPEEEYHYRPLAEEEMISVELYMTCHGRAAGEVYKDLRQLHLKRFQTEALTLEAVQKLVRERSRIIPESFDMCSQSHMAYTGLWKDRTDCPKCGESRYFTKTNQSGRSIQVSRRKYYVVPFEVPLQARWSTSAGAKLSKHRAEQTALLTESYPPGSMVDELNDIYCGRDYLQAVHDLKILPTDCVLALSLDGAQIYNTKKPSDSIFIILIDYNLPPEVRYKQQFVIPLAIIPGPHPPWNQNSFLLPIFDRIKSLHATGFPLFDGDREHWFRSRPFVALGLFDTLCQTAVAAEVGHNGRMGCHINGCTLIGAHQPGAPTYYFPLTRPNDYFEPLSMRPNYDPYNLPTETPDQYRAHVAAILQAKVNDQPTLQKRLQREYGIVGESLFSQIETLGGGPPFCFVIDGMHHPNFNFTELMVGLWRGIIRPTDKKTKKTSSDGLGKRKRGKTNAEAQEIPATDRLPWETLLGARWQQHGVEVANTRCCLPSFWDKFCRNIDIKYSGYRAKEWETYFYGLGPGLLQSHLPPTYFQHYLKIVYCMRALRQRSISQDLLNSIEKLIIEFVLEFEDIYYQNDIKRLHFCRPSLHKLLHLCEQTRRVGPFIYITQWTLERTIGLLGSRIRQHSRPYENLAQETMRQAQCQAVRSIDPTLILPQTQRPPPRGALPLGNSFSFLRAREADVQLLPSTERSAVEAYLSRWHPPDTWNGRFTKWARLQLPQNEIVRTRWKELQRPLDEVRISRQIKYKRLMFPPSESAGPPAVSITYAEVLYFLQLKVSNLSHHLALIQPYRDCQRHDPFGVLTTCQPALPGDFEVVNVKQVRGVVAVIPTSWYNDWFIVERLGGLGIETD